MCGIVGYMGPRNAVGVILKGLKRLEYRGYDSAGVCILEEEKLKIYKATGKIANLEKLTMDHHLTSNLAIGHTRWATHGRVVSENAHPHGDENVAIVHNGIIENAYELKRELQQEGFAFQSDTDSEVFFVLISKYLQQGHPLPSAIRHAFQLATGNSAFVIIDKRGHEIYAIKRSAPLVCGENSGESEVFVSSDPYALIGYAETIYFPADDVLSVLHCHGKKIEFFELDGSESRRVHIQAQETNYVESEKGPYEHFMLKEIHEQPYLIRSWINYYFEGDGREILARIQQKYPHRHLHLSACGTAWHAGLLIRGYLEKFTRCYHSIDLASEFRYRNPVLNPSDLGLFISQSGETADTLAAQELCLKSGLETISIVNVAGSTLYRNSQENLLIRGGMEIGVASTKAFTLQVLTGLLLAHTLTPNADLAKLKAEISQLATQMEAVLAMEPMIRDIAEEIHMKKGFMFTGRGHYYPVALEGALKLKEIAYVHAEGYAAGELKHGPIAMIDEEMVNIAILGPELFDKALSNMYEIKARRGIIVAIAPRTARESLTESDYLIPLDFSESAELNPLLANLVLQIFAYHMAKYKGTDIDQPRNLAKSVTVE